MFLILDDNNNLMHVADAKERLGDDWRKFLQRAQYHRKTLSPAEACRTACREFGLSDDPPADDGKPFDAYEATQWCIARWVQTETQIDKSPAFDRPRYATMWWRILKDPKHGLMGKIVPMLIKQSQKDTIDEREALNEDMNKEEIDAFLKDMGFAE